MGRRLLRNFVGNMQLRGGYIHENNTKRPIVFKTFGLLDFYIFFFNELYVTDETGQN